MQIGNLTISPAQNYFAVLSVFYFLFLSTGTFEQVTIPPTQTDTLVIETNANDKADAGDRFRYKVTTTNIGSVRANGTQWIVSSDGQTEFIFDSFRSLLAAMDDNFSGTGNISISLIAASSLRINDFDDNTKSFSIALA